MTGALLLVLLAQPAPPTPPPAPEAPRTEATARARAERDEVRLGEPFRYELEVRHPAAESVALPPALALDPFRATSASCRREAQGDAATTTCALTLALYALGPHDVPAIPLTVQTPRGTAALKVPGPRVTGVGIIDPGVPTRELALRDPAPPVPLLVRTLRPLAWALGALAAGALAVVAVRAWRRRARAVAEPAPPPPPHVALARQLDAIEAERLAARGLGREHVARVADVARAAIGLATGHAALDLTTAELLDRLERDPDPRLEVGGVRAFLERADVVKFAREDADPAECAAATAFTRALLARTRPQPAAPAGGAA